MKFNTTIGDCLPVVVEYDYEEGQREIQFPNDSAQPGFDPCVTINAVMAGEADLLDVLSENCIEELEEGAMESFTENMREF